MDSQKSNKERHVPICRWFIIIAIACVATQQVCLLTLLQTERSLLDPSKSNIDCPTLIDNTKNNKKFELAYNQSYGFFYDIDETNWKLKQKRARERIHHATPTDPLKFYRQPNNWYLNNFEPDFTCGQEWRVLGPGDGPKWVCDPHRLKEIAKRRRRQKNDNNNNNNEDDEEGGCLIYSIGSKGRFEFEDGIMELLNSTKLCEIHVFDPSNYARGRGGVENLKNQYNMHYHQWGFKSSYDPSYKPFVGGEFLSLQETMTKLNHTHRTIDIFKIDCEGCEWYSYKDWFEFDIRMMLIETHNLPKREEILPYFYSFQEHNYFMFHKEPNIHPRAGGNGIEWGYIKLHPDFAPYNQTVSLT